ncbi:inositol monophosphatase family protein [Nostocoides australiense]
MTPAAVLPGTDEWLEGLGAPDDDGDLAAALVRRGAAIGAHLRAGPLERTRKTSAADFVTAADHRAEADIVAALSALRPDDGIVGEEGSTWPSSSGRTWVIDPIDGTFNFANGVGPWCSAIALRHSDGSLVGAIRQEPSDETWVGRVDAHGQGETTLNGRRLPKLPGHDLADGALATYLHARRLADPALLEPCLAAARGAATVRMFGSSSSELAAVATGRTGAFLQCGTADWDWYPGLALVRGVGGVGSVIHHRDRRWHIAGASRVVDQVTHLLTSA